VASRLDEAEHTVHGHVVADAGSDDGDLLAHPVYEFRAVTGAAEQPFDARTKGPAFDPKARATFVLLGVDGVDAGWVMARWSMFALALGDAAVVEYVERPGREFVEASAESFLAEGALGCLVRMRSSLAARSRSNSRGRRLRVYRCRRVVRPSLPGRGERHGQGSGRSCSIARRSPRSSRATPSRTPDTRRSSANASACLPTPPLVNVRDRI
jgi:hypothetical protein